MKRKLFSIILIFLLSSPSWSETLTKDDLVERNDLNYKKFTDVPFTGEVSGIWTGKFKEGKKDGKWFTYHENGQLDSKGNWKDGKKDGFWEGYYSSGQLMSKGNWKDGKKDGFWEGYHENGQLMSKGNWNDGKKDGLREYFKNDGSLDSIETWKDGERINCEGFWC